MPFSDVASGYVETVEEKIQLQACNEISRALAEVVVRHGLQWSAQEIKTRAEELGIAIAAGHAAFGKERVCDAPD